MANLKDLKVRIDSVKSTRKITSAMKMVAAAKLRRAQEQAEASRPYAQRMERMLGSLAHRDRKSTRLNSSHYCASRMPTSAWTNKPEIPYETHDMQTGI